MREAWTDVFIDSFREVGQRLASLAPRLLAALVLLTLGWVGATIARRVVVRALRAADLDGRCSRWGLTAALGRAGIRRSPSQITGRLVFWVIFAIGLLMGIEALEVPATVGLVTMAARFLPSLVVAILVLVAGWVAAHFLAQAVLIFVVNAQVAGGPMIASVVRWLVLAFAAGIALTQLGIAREMVLLIFGIVLGGTVLALALAFGLGGRDLAREALESWLRKREREEADRLSHL